MIRTCVNNSLLKLMGIYERIEDVGYGGKRSWTFVYKRHFAQLRKFYGLWSFQGDKESEMILALGSRLEAAN